MKGVNGVNPEMLMRRVRDLPPLPPLLQKVLLVVEDRRSSARDLSRLIELDPSFTSKVLRLVNSAYYGFTREVATVRQAVAILGFSAVRGLALSFSLFEILRPTASVGGLEHQHLWEHCVGTAIGARLLAQRRCPEKAGEAFSAGLLHDLGKLVFMRYVPETYAAVLSEAAQRCAPLPDVERQLMGMSHSDVGRLVAGKWRLPALLEDAIGFHHAPAQATQRADFAHLVHVANALCKIAGVGFSGDTTLAAPLADSLSYYRLTETDLKDVILDLDRQRAAVVEPLVPSETGVHIVGGSPPPMKMTA